MEKAIYLYCLARSDLLQPVEGQGCDFQNPLFQKKFQEITAIMSTVSLEEFCGPSAESRMTDLAWIGPRAFRHEGVIEEVMNYSPVLPVRFGTLFSSWENLEKQLEKHYEAISTFLDQVMDKEEWAVKGFLDRIKAKEEFFKMTLSAKEDLPFSPGVRYFEEKRILAQIEKDLKTWLKEICNEIVKELNGYAADFTKRKILPDAHQGNEREVIFNWAFLLPRRNTADFREKIDQMNKELSKRRLTIEVTGPWPPYSFSPSFEVETKE